MWSRGKYYVAIYFVLSIKVLAFRQISLSLFERDDRHIDSPHPPPGSDVPLLSPGSYPLPIALG